MMLTAAKSPHPKGSATSYIVRCHYAHGQSVYHRGSRIRRCCITELPKTARNYILPLSLNTPVYLYEVGSNASRRPSPITYRHSTVITISKPGKMTRCGPVLKNDWALLSILPQVGVGG